MRKATSSKEPSLTAIPLLAGFLVPGLGHVLMKRMGHAAVFGLAIYLLFIIGMVYSGGTGLDPITHDFHWLVQHLLGLPFLITAYGDLYAEARIGDNVMPDQQAIGVAYVSIAALCNVISLAELIRHDPAARYERDGDAADEEAGS